MRRLSENHRERARPQAGVAGSGPSAGKPGPGESQRRCSQGWGAFAGVGVGASWSKELTVKRPQRTLRVGGQTSQVVARPLKDWVVSCRKMVSAESSVHCLFRDHPGPRGQGCEEGTGLPTPLQAPWVGMAPQCPLLAQGAHSGRNLPGGRGGW